MLYSENTDFNRKNLALHGKLRDWETGIEIEHSSLVLLGLFGCLGLVFHPASAMVQGFFIPFGVSVYRFVYLLPGNKKQLLML